MASQAAWLALWGLWEVKEDEEDTSVTAEETELRRWLPKLRLLIQLRLESGMVMEEQLLS